MFHSKTARLNNLTRVSVAGALIALPLVAFAPIASARIPADPDAGPEIMFAENGVDPNGFPIALDAPGNAQGNDLALQQEPNELGLEQLIPGQGVENSPGPIIMEYSPEPTQPDAAN
ncbi:hypothetical protein [Mycobacterium decipiens]|uniref:Uncharacterized protein n=1 Tax=Mycobacterium decipiens TaxID=1430326 RepID=A0A1X2LWG8_9MYCO|nr:hypothetical protein [Mycobacterium decipiens]OSC41499.1 hypothetical protein B8W66_09020 [Mycobacterium decipiens]